MIDLNLADITDEELEELRVRLQIEQERRYTIENAERHAAIIAERYAVAIGREDGDTWTQPTGAHDAYREGAIVSHQGKTWVSTTPANVWEPGVSGWHVAGGDEEGTAPEWVQPTGGHDTYGLGAQVTFEGQVWESTIPNNSWSPRDYPNGWKLIG